MITKHNIDSIRAMVAGLHRNPAPVLQSLAAYQEASKDVTPEQRSAWLKEQAGADNRVVMSDAIAAAVNYKVDLDVLAHLFALAFFQNTTLGEGDWPIVHNEKRDGKMRTTYLGESGGTPKKQWIDRRSHTSYLVEKFTTNEVEYQLFDLQTGNVSAVDKVIAELSYELNLGIDKLARAVMDAGETNSGLRAQLNLHPDIVVANIPDTNHLDLNSVDTAGKASVEKFKRILDHFERFASDVEIDGQPLQIRTIYMSSVNKRDMWDFADLVAGYNLAGAVQDPSKTVPGDVRGEIWRSGRLESLFGYQFNIVTRNTIAEGRMYVGTNKPIGWYFNKPSMSNVWRDEDRRRNKGSAAMERVHLFVMPDVWKYRYLTVDL